MSFTNRLLRAALASSALLLACSSTPLPAAVGDPQLKTDHPFYPGELSCSTFERLFATQAEVYKRATGRDVTTDEDKALASWYWRNTHYYHGEEGQRDCFSAGFKGDKNRDYWTGLFADGFALCGTTHAQWCAEMDALLGHCRSRVAGVAGHNSFEVFLTGGAYGQGAGHFSTTTSPPSSTAMTAHASSHSMKSSPTSNNLPTPRTSPSASTAGVSPACTTTTRKASTPNTNPPNTSPDTPARPQPFNCAAVKPSAATSSPASTMARLSSTGA